MMGKKTPLESPHAGQSWRLGVKSLLIYKRIYGDKQKKYIFYKGNWEIAAWRRLQYNFQNMTFIEIYNMSKIYLIISEETGGWWNWSKEDLGSWYIGLVKKRMLE